MNATPIHLSIFSKDQSWNPHSGIEYSISYIVCGSASCPPECSRGAGKHYAHSEVDRAMLPSGCITPSIVSITHMIGGKWLSYNWLRCNVTSKLPIRVQYLLYLTLMPPFLAKQWIKNAFGLTTNKLTWREKCRPCSICFPLYINIEIRLKKPSNGSIRKAVQMFRYLMKDGVRDSAFAEISRHCLNC